MFKINFVEKRCTSLVLHTEKSLKHLISCMQLDQELERLFGINVWTPKTNLKQVLVSRLTGNFLLDS